MLAGQKILILHKKDIHSKSVYIINTYGLAMWKCTVKEGTTMDEILENLTIAKFCWLLRLKV